MNQTRKTPKILTETTKAENIHGRRRNHQEKVAVMRPQFIHINTLNYICWVRPSEAEGGQGLDCTRV